jgi:hypothetical protein
MFESFYGVKFSLGVAARAASPVLSINPRTRY